MAPSSRDLTSKEWIEEKANLLFRKGGEVFFRTVVESITAAGRKVPLAHPEKHGVRLISDVPYSDAGISERVLDVYMPSHVREKPPVVLYIHGGGFRYCSKDTHWMMALSFALQGFAVFNINYRLAPKHRFPAAFEDACFALGWLHRHGAEYGCDTSRIVIAGESAGANLATSLALATSYRRRQPYARMLWEAKVRPSAIIALCGMLQVTNPERITEAKSVNPWVRDRLLEPAMGYAPFDEAVDTTFLDPLLFLEQGKKARRKLPAFLVSAGTKDPLLDDSRRLASALLALRVPHEFHVYPGALHAFQAMVWDTRSKEYWRTQAEFLHSAVGPLEPLGGDFVSVESLIRVLGLRDDTKRSLDPSGDSFT